MAIENISDLREASLKCLDKLTKGEISIEEAGATAKVCETIISGCRLEMDYAKAQGREPKIAFLGKCTGNITIEHQKKAKQLEGNK